MDFRTARAAMVESQIRPNGVRDPLLLKAFATVPREMFVPESTMPLAYMDEALRIETGDPVCRTRYLLPPMTLARLLQSSEPGATERALDIGGLTGYSAAILSRLCGKVYALEASPNLAQQMSSYLERAGIAGVTVAAGPLKLGLEAHRPYGLILVNGLAAEEPRNLFEQLAEGGRLVCLIGGRWHGHAHIFEKSEGVVSGRALFDASGEVLPSFEAQPQFVF